MDSCGPVAGSRACCIGLVSGVLWAKCRLAIVSGYIPPRGFWLSRWLGILWTVNACVAVDAVFCLKQLRGWGVAGD